jgi:hypothetical protein
MSTPLFPVQRVSESEMRQLFNEGRFWERAQAGELRQVVQDSRHPSLPVAPVPHCTRSQIITYFDAGGVEVATVHQYLQPDGTLGASGRPDPKKLLVSGVLYRLRVAPPAVNA